MDKQICFQNIADYILELYSCPEQIEDKLLLKIIKDYFKQLIPIFGYSYIIDMNFVKEYKKYIKNCKKIFIKQKQLKDKCSKINQKVIYTYMYNKRTNNYYYTPYSL